MIKRRGRMKYVPGNVISAIENIRAAKQLNSDSEAFKKMVEHARVGMELEAVRDKFFLRDFKKNKKRKGVY